MSKIRLSTEDYNDLLKQESELRDKIRDLHHSYGLSYVDSAAAPRTTGEKVRLVLWWILSVVLGTGVVAGLAWNDEQQENRAQARFENVCQELGGKSVPGKDETFECIRDQEIVYTAIID